MFNSGPVLIVSADPAHCEKTSEIAHRLGLQCDICTSLMDARAHIEKRLFQFVFCSDELPDCNLRTALSVLSSATGGVPIIVLSHLADWDAYMRALDAGAFDYIACPPDPIELERILRLTVTQPPPRRRASHTAA